MKNRIRILLKRFNYRYLLIGGSVYLLELVVIITTQYLGASAYWAVGLSFWVGLVASFWLQKIVAFGDKRLHRQVLIPQIFAFSALVLFNFTFTLFVTKLLISVLPAVLIRTLTLAITTTWNYYLYRTHIFKMPESPLYW